MVEPHTDNQESATEHSAGNNEEKLIAEETIDELSKLHNEIQAMQDKLLRSMAETENVRTRLNKNVEEAKEYSITNFAKDLVPVMDNLARAIDHAPASPTDEMLALIEGIKMTQVELENVFARHGLESVRPQAGDKFDYNMHHAIAQAATDKHPEGSIVSTMQAGYKIKERLIRPASVVVAKPAE